jgi:GNAT superfamily N-acetyltransferase
MLDRTSLATERSLLDRQAREPERARRRSWVAVEESELIGWATAGFGWASGATETGNLWVGVHPERRSRGIGAELYRRAVRHLGENHARALETHVDDDPAGARFVGARGFGEAKRQVVSALRPADSDTSGLEALAEAKRTEGFCLTSLGELTGRERELFDFFCTAGAWPPLGPENRISFDEWRRWILENPLLSSEASAVILANDEPAALSWLLVDEKGRGENEWTATLPKLRHQGLARLAKLATIRWAAEHGISEIVTDNNIDKVEMLTLNQHLGYTQLFVRQEYERRIAGADLG